jgi:hypothetical protein
MKRDVQCKEIVCEHFRRYYEIIKTKPGSVTPYTNYTPDLNSIDKRCKHPSLNSVEGVRINELKACPNEKDIR